MDWLTSWEDVRRHKRRARVFFFAGAWAISITIALVLLGSTLGDLLVSVAFATVVALLVTLTFEPVLRQETHGPSGKPSFKSRTIGGVAGGVILALGTRVIAEATTGLIGMGFVIVGVTVVMAVMVWVADR